CCRTRRISRRYARRTLPTTIHPPHNLSDQKKCHVITICRPFQRCSPLPGATNVLPVYNRHWISAEAGQMRNGGTSRRRNLVLVRLAPLGLALAAWRWTGTPEPPVPPQAAAVPSPRATAVRREHVAEATHRPPMPAAQSEREAYSAS